MRSETILSIPAMKCGGCVDAIEKVLKDAGAENAKADLESKTVSFETEMPVATLISTIKTIGFDATEVA